MGRVVSILFGAAFTVAACWSTGKLVLAGLHLKLDLLEEHLFRFVVGSACLSSVIFILAAVNLAREAAFLAVGLVLILCALRTKSAPRIRARLPDLAAAWKVAFAAVILVYGAFYFLNALAPEVSPDGATYHLGLVHRYFIHHGFGRITTNMYASLSEAIEMLFLMAFAFGRHSAAAMVEFAFLVTLPFLVFSYTRRLGFPRAGVAAAILVFLSPIVGISGTSAYIDVAGACVVFALFYILQLWAQEKRLALLIPAGLLAGFAYGVKYTLFLAIPYAVLFVWWKERASLKAAIRSLAIVVGCAALMVVPWMGKNWVVVGNPFSPFMNRVFPNPYVTIAFEQEYNYLRSHPDGLSPLARPIEQTVLGARTGGLLGPVFLLAPLALLALRFAPGRQLLLAAFLFGLPALANLDTRFLIPSLPFLSTALALALMQIRVRDAVPLIVAVQVVLSWPSFVGRYCAPYAWRLHNWPLAAAFRIDPEGFFLSRRLVGYQVMQMVESKTPKDARVYSFAGVPEAYTSREVLVSYQSALGLTIRDILWTPLAPEQQATWMATFAFKAQPVHRMRVVETANSSDEWNISEVRILHGSEEVARTPEWKLRAQPNPWDIGLAFDNNPATRWRTEEAMRSGMYVDVDFGRPTEVDKVVLECSHDEWGMRLRLDSEVKAGVWQTVAPAPNMSEDHPSWDLRKAAMAQVKAYGITHLLVNGGDFGHAEFRANPGAWGLSLIGESEGFQLYKVL